MYLLRLLTPPDTPLFPSLEKEAPKPYVNQLGTPKGRSTSLKSRQANPQIEIPKRNSLASKQPASCPVSSSAGTRRPSSSGGPGSVADRGRSWGSLDPSRFSV
ncbi:unnamed protein product [Rhodiola kirilowii]